MSQTIHCPHCKHEIDLDKIADEKFSAKLFEQEKLLKREAEKQRESFEKEMETKTEEMRKKAQEYADKKAGEERKKVELEMKDMQEQLLKAEKERAESKKVELEMMKKQRDLEEKEKNFELEMEKKLGVEMKQREKIMQEKMQEEYWEKSKKELDERMEKIQEDARKKELEMLKQQEQMKKTIDELKRKSEQWSQQIQWDIQEDDLRDALSQAFPLDEVSDVATWVKWADLMQEVRDNFGRKAGVIVWESKNTKSWQDAWVMKLKDDTLKSGGTISILVTTVLPKDIKHFWMYDGVMVTSPSYVIHVAELLRTQILAIHKTEKSLEWKDVKMEMLYKYLSSQEFSSKMNMMVDVFSNLKSGIDMERRAMEKNWKKREKDLERATYAVTWMYGELESLMWQALPGSEMLSLDSWEDDEDENTIF